MMTSILVLAGAAKLAVPALLAAIGLRVLWRLMEPEMC